jgi:hypothetical protein
VSILSTNESAAAADFSCASAAVITGKLIQIQLGEIQATGTTTVSAVARNTITLAGEYELYTWSDTDPYWVTWPYQRWGLQGQHVQRAAWSSDIDYVYLLDGTADWSAVSTQTTGSVNIKLFDWSAVAQTQWQQVETLLIQALLDLSTIVTLDVKFAGLIEAAANWETQAQLVSRGSADFVSAAVLPAEFAADSAAGLIFDTVVSAAAESAVSAMPLLTLSTTIAADLQVNQSTAAAVTTGSRLAAAAETQTQITGNADFVMQMTAAAAADLSTTSLTVLHRAGLVTDIVGSTMIVGRRASADPFRTHVIYAENRSLPILVENRVFAVSAQNRVLRVPVPPYNQQLTRRVA